MSTKTPTSPSTNPIRIIASAIVYRVLHHVVSVSIKGESYRLKEKLKAGLLAKHVEQS